MSEAGMEENSIKNYDIESWQEVILIYRSALKQVETKMEILNDEFQHVHQYNPIEHIKSRIKTPESIVRKLNRYGLEPTISNMVERVNDIAGIRLICSFTSDIYELAQIIAQQKDINVISVKDYIRYPKQSGYRSYHMIITIPVYLTEKTVNTRVEIQIRTVAMDFWASLEHKIKYKFEGTVPEDFREELLVCSKMVTDLDGRMEVINEAIQELNREKEEEQQEFIVQK
ncbi:MAG: GTP pyrophosphokinase family protein [Lachnospiraceae bacterium]|nr:GTP pyrophosphokinase family protein [Lachnospiraceae bacterium]